MSTRLLSDAPFHVVPDLVGAPLASPRRRLAAFAADYVILIVPTVIVAVGAAWLALRIGDPPALRTLIGMVASDRAERAQQPDFMRRMTPLLVRYEADGVPCAVVTAVEEGDIERAAAALQGYDILVAYNLEETHKVVTKEKTITLRLDHMIPKGLRAIVLYSVGALYFALLTTRGATLGKRMMGIRVVRLDGHRLTLMESLERFVGYLHIPGSLGLSLLDLWRDPNRRMPHDRVVHTAVIRVVKPRPTPRPAPQPVAEDEA
jgi:uncharacterized RDD family membrane protein YckC